MICDYNVDNVQYLFSPPSGSVIAPVCKVYYTYQILMPLGLIDCIYSLSGVFGTKIIKFLSSNTSCFIVCEATCFGPYMTIIRPICESS